MKSNGLVWNENNNVCVFVSKLNCIGNRTLSRVFGSFSLSPSSFMKKLNDLVRSENTRSNLEVPSHPAQLTADTQQSDDGGGGSSESDEPAGSSIALNIAVPNTKHNVVAPWEEDI